MLPRPFRPGPGSIVGIGCEDTGACVTGLSNGAVLSSDDPAGGGLSYVRSRVLDPAGFAGRLANPVACPSFADGRQSSPCFISDRRGGVAAVSPGPPVNAAVATGLGGTTAVTGLACPGRSLCVGVDSGGGIIRSFAPFVQTAWTRVVQPTARDGLSAVSCPSVHFCAASAQQQPGAHERRPPPLGAGTRPRSRALSWPRSIVRRRASASRVPMTPGCCSPRSPTRAGTLPRSARHPAISGGRSRAQVRSCASPVTTPAGRSRPRPTRPRDTRRGTSRSTHRRSEVASPGSMPSRARRRRSASPPTPWAQSTGQPIPPAVPTHGTRRGSTTRRLLPSPAARRTSAWPPTGPVTPTSRPIPPAGRGAWHETTIALDRSPRAARTSAGSPALACAPQTLCLAGNGVGAVFPGRTG